MDLKSLLVEEQVGFSATLKSIKHLRIIPKIIIAFPIYICRKSSTFTSFFNFRNPLFSL